FLPNAAANGLLNGPGLRGGGAPLGAGRDGGGGDGALGGGALACLIDSPMRRRSASTLITLTRTPSPTRPASDRSRPDFLASSATWTRPSWCTPTSTNAPNCVTLVTTPLSTIPSWRCANSVTAGSNPISTYAPRGSRPGFSSSLTMSRSVGSPRFVSTYFD